MELLAILPWEGWLTLLVVLFVFCALIFTKLSSDLVLISALTFLVICGIVSVENALKGFSNQGLITVGALFIVATGIRQTGGMDFIVNNVLGRPQSKVTALLRLTLPVASMSAFLNNTPLVATMIPAVARWAKRIQIPPSYLMIPLSYAAILGGTMTLIGTSTNLVVNSEYMAITQSAGLSLFDITRVGLPVALICLLFLMFLVPLVLKHKGQKEDPFAEKTQFTFEVAVAHNGPLTGKTIEEAGLRHLPRIYLVEIERAGRIVTAVPSEERLQGGDRLVFVGDTEAILDVLHINGLVPSDNKDPIIERNVPERRLVEAVVSPNSECVGSTIRDSRFRDRYGAVVLAVARHGQQLKGNLGSIRIQSGDLLLLEARPAFVTRQRYNKEFLLVNDLDTERPKHQLAYLAWAILLTMIAVAGFEIIPMVTAALLAAVAMIFTRCCSLADAKRSLDSNVLLTIAASFALGSALQSTGSAQFLAENFISVAGNNPFLILALCYFIVSALTEVISNNAAAILMLPIVLAITEPLGLNPIPFVVCIMMAASASFATPIGYQTNLMVYGPGGYSVKDFLRIGIPMNIVAGLASILFISLGWNLQL